MHLVCKTKKEMYDMQVYLFNRGYAWIDDTTEIFFPHGIDWEHQYTLIAIYDDPKIISYTTRNITIKEYDDHKSFYEWQKKSKKFDEEKIKDAVDSLFKLELGDI